MIFYENLIIVWKYIALAMLELIVIMIESPLLVQMKYNKQSSEVEMLNDNTRLRYIQAKIKSYRLLLSAFEGRVK